MLDSMQKKKRRKEPSQTILASVKKEMAKPRRAESTRREADTIANGGHIAMVELSTRTPVPFSHQTAQEMGVQK
jgi:hypothetical protein